MPIPPSKHPCFDSVFPQQGIIQSFQSAFIKWFVENGAVYPWRETKDPYAILVSELMLQQTRITTVLERGYFNRWMSLFPDWKSLATAEESEILKAWEGLGYYNRARNLQAAARVICSEHGGEMPDELNSIQALPGVGPYTAGAVYSFAFEKSAPIVDGNVIRVLARIFSFVEPIDTTPARKLFWEWAERLTPEKHVSAYNSGIMELGQKVCTKGAPDCSACPVAEWCLSAGKDTAAKLPRKGTSTKITEKREDVALVIDRGSILLQQESGSRRRGLWRLPALVDEQSADSEEWIRFSYAITRYKVDLRIFRVSPAVQSALDKNERTEWHRLGEDLETLPPLGSPYRKAILRWIEESSKKLL